jgi:hypothetical protein
VSVELSPGEAREIGLPPSSAGYTVSSTSEVVVAWRSATVESLVLSVALPLPESAP